MKKTGIAAVAALALAASQIMMAPAYAEAPFRAPAPQTFTAQDLEAYGLDAATAERAEALQAQGYQVLALTPEEADSYTAGITDNQWLMLGILAGVIVIAVAVVD